MRAASSAAAIFAGLTLAAACGGRGSGVTLARSTTDRPDDHAGPQIHFVYAVPAGDTSVDNHRDTDGVLTLSILLVFSWFHQQAGAPTLSVDTYRGHPDVTFVRLPRMNGAYERARPDAIADAVERALRPRRGKLLAIYYDGTLPAGEADVCGIGRGRPGAFAIAFVGQQCFSTLDFSDAALGSYNDLVFVMAHEIVHELGFVPGCAPHSTGSGHVDDSRRDLMSPLLGDRVPVLDVGHDDYYDAHVRGCPDLSRSPYLHGPRALLKMKP